ncbi:ATP-dependent DNA helicase PIF1 [Tanacetum coccineum]
MGVNLDKRYGVSGSGVDTFCVQGGIYHKVDQLVPRDGEPRYLQLYFYDPESEFEHRLKWPNLDREIVTILSRVLEPNPYAYFACYDPLSYPMFFPNGEAGWHKRIPREGVDIRELIDDDDDDGVEDEEVHLPNNQFVRFREDDVLTDILNRERNKRSMLTALFELNKTDPNARQYFIETSQGPTDFDYLYTVDDVLYTTFRRAALERGLIKSDNYIHECLRESSTHELPYALRRLFATLLIFCEQGDVRKLWDDHYESLLEDYILNCASIERIQNVVLTNISTILQSMGKSLSDFDLPNITTDVRPYAFGCRKVHEEETFLYKALLANVHSCGLIALATASSGAAANNMTGGRNAQTRFKIQINLTTNSMCNIKKQSGLAKLLGQAKLIIWDEAPMAKRQAVEAVDRTMQDIIGVKLPYGGKIVVLG